MDSQSCWKLRTVNVENFKSIKACVTNIPDGFTVITGPNGSGKSNFLESISFGLGATATTLREKNLGGMSNVNNSSRRTTVKLTFRKNENEFTVGSSIVDGKRLYQINMSTVSREKFTDALTAQLGFSKHSFCWNISQHAVQDIITAPPAVLHQTLSYIAHTSTLLENQTKAQGQVELFGAEISSINGKMSALEAVLGAADRMNALVVQLIETGADHENAIRAIQLVESLRLLLRRSAHADELKHISTQLDETRQSLLVCQHTNCALSEEASMGSLQNDAATSPYLQSEEALVATQQFLQNKIQALRKEHSCVWGELEALRRGAVVVAKRAVKCQCALYRAGAERDQFVGDITTVEGEIESLQALLDKSQGTSTSMVEEYRRCKRTELASAEGRRLGAESESMSLTASIVCLESRVDAMCLVCQNHNRNALRLAGDFQQHCFQLKQDCMTYKLGDDFSQSLTLVNDLGYCDITTKIDQPLAGRDVADCDADRSLLVTWADIGTRLISCLKDRESSVASMLTTPALRAVLERMSASCTAVRIVGRRLSLPDMFLIDPNLGNTELSLDHVSTLTHCYSPGSPDGCFLLELVSPRFRGPNSSSDPVAGRYTHALYSLMEPYLSVRVCRTDEEATGIIKRIALFNNSSPASTTLKIWPLESLSVPGASGEVLASPINRGEGGCEFLNPMDDNSNLIRALSTKLIGNSQQSGAIVDPASLLQWADKRPRYALLDRAVKKVVGQWVLVESEELAHRVLDLVKQANVKLDSAQCSGTVDNAMETISRLSGCITPDGRKHVLGVMHMSGRPAVPVRGTARAFPSAGAVARLRDWKEYASLMASLSDDAGELAEASAVLELVTAKRCLISTFLGSGVPILTNLLELLRQWEEASREGVGGVNTLSHLRINLDLQRAALIKHTALVDATRQALQKPAGDVDPVSRYTENLALLRGKRRDLELLLSESADKLVELESEYLLLSGRPYDGCAASESVECSHTDPQVILLQQSLAENTALTEACGREYDTVLATLRQVRECGSARREALIAHQAAFGDAQGELHCLSRKQGVLFEQLTDALANVSPEDTDSVLIPDAEDTLDINIFGTPVPASLRRLLVEFLSRARIDFCAAAVDSILNIGETDHVDGMAVFACSVKMVVSDLRQSVLSTLDALSVCDSEGREETTSSATDTRMRHRAAKGKSVGELVGRELTMTTHRSMADQCVEEGSTIDGGQLKTFVDVQYVHYKSCVNSASLRSQQLLAEAAQLAHQNQLMKSMLMNPNGGDRPVGTGGVQAATSSDALSLLTKDPQFCGYLASISSKITVLRTKYQQTIASVDSLRNIVDEIRQITRQVHARVFCKLARLFRIFHELLVPPSHVGVTSSVHLVPVNPVEDNLEEGFTFELQRGVRLTGDLPHAGHSAVSQLSGGQRAMLGLAFVFAVLTTNAPGAVVSRLSSSRTPDISRLLCAGSTGGGNPVYLLDEVDAALDETNQKLVSKVIIALFNSNSQVLCVSHHSEFQKYATSTIPVLMQQDGFSKIG